MVFPLARAGVIEQTFTVPLGQLFVLDQHGGPAVRMRASNADASFVDMNSVDEFGRLWGGALLSFANWHLKIRLASS